MTARALPTSGASARAEAPASLTPDAREADVASLLAMGYLRVKARRDAKSRLPRPAGDVITLHVAEEERP